MRENWHRSWGSSPGCAAAALQMWWEHVPLHPGCHATAGGATCLGKQGISCGKVSHTVPLLWKCVGACSSTAGLWEEKCVRTSESGIWDKACFLRCQYIESLNLWVIKKSKRRKARERPGNICSVPLLTYYPYMLTYLWRGGALGMLRRALDTLLAYRFTLTVLECTVEKKCSFLLMTFYFTIEYLAYVIECLVYENLCTRNWGHKSSESMIPLDKVRSREWCYKYHVRDRNRMVWCPQGKCVNDWGN